MSAAAIANLQKRWEKLTISSVKRTIAREPEDVLSIHVPNTITSNTGLIITNHTHYCVISRRTSDIPPADRWKAEVWWKHYYGFTYDGIYFQRSGATDLDFNCDQTLTWGEYGEHDGGFFKPKSGALIAGQVVTTGKGRRFDRWFVCPPELEFLIHIVRDGKTGFSEYQLAERLLSGADYPDQYWALARLLFFDNVQAFVDQYKPNPPLHPCCGKPFNAKGFLGKMKPKVCWSGMALPHSDPARFVHLLSYHLGEPKWWEEFQRLAKEQYIEYEHPGGDYCEACDEDDFYF